MDPITYRAAGVDVDAGDRAVRLMKDAVRSTFRKEVLDNFGGFGGLISLPDRPYKQPVLVAGTDGVGTKLKLAFLADRHDTIGIDCVAMCVNDVLVQGAEPLFLLDYIATGKLVPEKIASIVAGVADGCRQAGCALIGGETAEMPGMYAENEYDLAGFSVGVADRGEVVDGSSIQPGDQLIGLASSGLHSNGFSLVRKLILEVAGHQLTDVVPELGAAPLVDILLKPTRIYVKSVLELLRRCSVKGMAHITGGGPTENIPRMFPAGCGALLDRGSWPVPPIFSYLQRIGQVPTEDIYRTFNMGIGFVLAVPAEQAEQVIALANELGETAYHIGEVIAGQGVTYR